MKYKFIPLNSLLEYNAHRSMFKKLSSCNKKNLNSKYEKATWNEKNLI